MIQKHSS